MWSIRSWVEVLLFYFQCFVAFLWHVSHWKEKSNTKHAHPLACEVLIILPWSSTVVMAQEYFCSCSSKLMISGECSPPLLFSSSQKRAKENEMQIRNSLRMLAFYPRQCKSTEEAKVVCCLLVKWKWSNGNCRLYIFVCPCIQDPLMMHFIRVQKDDVKCWLDADSWGQLRRQCFSQLKCLLNITQVQACILA